MINDDADEFVWLMMMLNDEDSDGGMPNATYIFHQIRRKNG